MKIPDIHSDPDLFEVTTKNMIHGQCGSLNPNLPCMPDGKCTKRYPKDLLAKTITRNDGYPLYRRSPEDGGNTIILKARSCELSTIVGFYQWQTVCEWINSF